ncbi:MAG TPA: replication-relaxation family protein, partial [Pseudonocardiaceae bacterium]|nr:replication-relaxation family protein [Pseudonocardiaceae bacterium]
MRRINAGESLLRVQSQLTRRDRQLLSWLYDHGTLTSMQISQELFPSQDVAARRLRVLHRLDLVERTRPLREGGGSYPWRFLLSRLGTEVVATSRDEEPPRSDLYAARRRALIDGPGVPHLLGANQFFIDLAAHARTHPDAELLRWWCDRQCQRFGVFVPHLYMPVRPDGFGVWRDGERVSTFFVEHDTGSEKLSVLLGKVARYNQFVIDGAPRWPVLLWLHSTSREQHLHDLLRDVRTRVPVATAARDHTQRIGAGPADAIWLLHGHHDAPLRLAHLPAARPPDDLADQIDDDRVWGRARRPWTGPRSTSGRRSPDRPRRSAAARGGVDASGSVVRRHRTAGAGRGRRARTRYRATQVVLNGSRNRGKRNPPRDNRGHRL